MKYLLFLLSLISIDTTAAHWSSYEGKFYCPNIYNSKECASDIESKLNYPFIKRINNSHLEIKLKSGEIRAFINVYNDKTYDDNVSYQAIEVTLSSRYVVLNEQHYEGGSFGLLDRHNGNYYHLKGYPAFSPDGLWLAVTNTDLIAGYSPNVFQIYRVTDNSIDLVFDAKPGNDWAPEDVVWKSSTLISYTHATAECWEFKEMPCKSAFIKYEDGKWK